MLVEDSDVINLGLENFGNEDVLLKFSFFIYDSLNSSKCVSGLFLDIKKRLSHGISWNISFTINNNGINGIVNNWLRSYVSDQLQVVRIGKCINQSGEVKHGIPQVGTTFISCVYINRLRNASLHSEVISFADDTFTGFLAIFFRGCERWVWLVIWKHYNFLFFKFCMMHNTDKTKFFFFKVNTTCSPGDNFSGSEMELGKRKWYNGNQKLLCNIIRVQNKLSNTFLT